MAPACATHLEPRAPRLTEDRGQEGLGPDAGRDPCPHCLAERLPSLPRAPGTWGRLRGVGHR